MIYGLITAAIILLIVLVIRFMPKASREGSLIVKNLNSGRLTNLNKIIKSINKKAKVVSKFTNTPDTVFVLNFKGNLQATQVQSLRKEISAILDFSEINKPKEVVVNLSSPGGTVTGYGLAAAQLERLRKADIPLTVCVDQVAASGGYKMAVVANKIISAPYAIIGSIGVVMEMPNFSSLLKKVGIEYTQYTAGEHKRLVSPFVPPETKAVEKTKEKLVDTHKLFIEHIKSFRPQINAEEVCTGETWYGKEALKKNLVDEINTSDDYLRELGKSNRILQLEFKIPEKVSRKISLGVSHILSDLFDKFFEKYNY